mmetsp:Transcript_52669/g.163459  ORF Transcript_52669/g.163459 Transcript_52669/m.163459 type:complete len:203 (+) Transcript_52669:137-745(+)
MHRDSAGWGERLRMEDDAYWRFEQHQSKRRLATCGAGMLGAGTMGTGKTVGNFHPVAALHKTVSMPVLGPHPPCGRRVGDDVGMSECGDEPEESPFRRKPRLHGELESRLNFLERTFSSSQASHVAARGSEPPSRLSTGRGQPRGTESVRSLASRGSLAPSLASVGSGAPSLSMSRRSGQSLRSGQSMRSNLSVIESLPDEM